MVRLAGFEPATCCSGGNRSIHLSYRRTRELESTAAYEAGQGRQSSNEIAGKCLRQGLYLTQAF